MNTVRWIYVLVYHLTGIFKMPVQDEIFAYTLQQALEFIEPTASIPGDIHRGRAFDLLDDNKMRQEEEQWRQIAEAYAEHSGYAFAAYGVLKRVRPRRPHQRLHIQAIFTLNVYIRTLNAHMMKWHTSTVSWAEKQVMKQHFRYRDDARLGESLTYEAAVELVSLLEESSLTLEVPQGLQTISRVPPDLLS